MIQVKGNKIYQDDKELQLRGASIADPMFFSKTEIEWKQSVRELKDMGANCVRVPIIPSEYFRKKDDYLNILVEVIDYTKEKGLICIIDAHFVSNFKQADIYTFWNSLFSWEATSLKQGHIVLEIFNEPIVSKGKDWGNNNKWIREWNKLKEFTRPTMTYIRDEASFKGLIIHGTPNWSGSHYGISDNTIDDINLAYTLHAYNSKVSKEGWEDSHVELAEKYPVVITEMGYEVGGDIEGGDKLYAKKVRQKLINRFNMGYMFWSYSSLNGFNSKEDDNWGPNCVIYAKDTFKTPVLRSAGLTLKRWLKLDGTKLIEPVKVKTKYWLWKSRLAENDALEMHSSRFYSDDFKSTKGITSSLLSRAYYKEKILSTEHEE